MDTSEIYIKMRIAAIPDMGKGEPLEETLRSKNCYVFENDEYSVFISENGNWHTFHPAIEFDNEQGRTCQLERQDQLQAMVSGSAEIWGEIVYLGALLKFIGFICQYKKGQRIKFTENIDGLTSMEQLWLSFVQWELRQKKWDGEKWKE